ncbi:DUF3048 domain-containing protein [Microbacterium saccharophilum]|uniref:DUF3048 domain-containing protein n=1 Tax=Microbacterium saccharophilum TaxID=1213358 RepID=UPI001478FE0B|nr:DUF3048 domain-containing protein [Microbacterium saccharophilum]
MNLRRARLAGAAAFATAGLLLSACAPTPAAAPPPTPRVTHSAEPTPSSTPTPVPVVQTAPLRGTVVEDAAALGPALSAKIDNHPDARPQWGLEHTDIVFEELVEGGITRYVAVWHSDVPDEIGPVRSIRPMDPDIIAPFGGIAAYSGGQERFVAMMQDTDVHNAIHGGADDRFMYRATSHTAPHNVVVEARELRAEYATIAPPPVQFLFAPRGHAPIFGAAAGGIDVRFSTVSARSWRWDAGSAAYLRSQDGRADLDAAGAQLRATNVVVLQVAIDWSYGIVPRTVMVDSGDAWVSTGGSVIRGRWSKQSQTSPIALTNAAGGEIRLAPGNTWVELVPTSGSISVTG